MHTFYLMYRCSVVFLVLLLQDYAVLEKESYVPKAPYLLLFFSDGHPTNKHQKKWKIEFHRADTSSPKVT